MRKQKVLQGKESIAATNEYKRDYIAALCAIKVSEVSGHVHLNLKALQFSSQRTEPNEIWRQGREKTNK